MSRTLNYLLLIPVAVLVAVGIYLAGSLAGASDDEPPPREPVVLPSHSTSPSPSAPASSPSDPSSSVPVVSPAPIDDDDDDDDADDRDDGPDDDD